MVKSRPGLCHYGPVHARAESRVGLYSQLLGDDDESANRIDIPITRIPIHGMDDQKAEQTCFEASTLIGLFHCIPMEDIPTYDAQQRGQT